MALARRCIDPSLEDGALVAGVLSGTSADGIDVVIARARIERGVLEARLIGLDAVASATEPLAGELGRRVRAVLDGGRPSLAEVAVLHRDLGLAFGAAARAVSERAGAGPLALVASHGQTVFHHDGDDSLGKATLQLGDGDFVSEAAGCAVASDFRTRDCAAGGEGAPLVALVDDVLFACAPRPLAILNLGGIANWTVLRAGAPPCAADTGPAGALLDGLARRRLGAPFDAGGRAAAAGSVEGELLTRLLDHPYLRRPWPKTTGRDTFGPRYVESVLESAPELSSEDLLATAVRFVARAAAEALAGIPWSAADAGAGLEVAIAGGGAHNLALFGALEEEIRSALAPIGGRASPILGGFAGSDRYGVPIDMREALAFAALGVRLALGEPSTDPAATGASAGRILGKWSPTPPQGPIATAEFHRE